MPLLLRWLVFGMIWIIFSPFAAAQSGFGVADKIDSPSPPTRDSIDRLSDRAWSLARSDPDSALKLARLAITASKQANLYIKGMINAHTLLGILNKDRGYYGLSVEHYLQAMEMAEAEGDCLRVSGCLNNLGVVAQQQGDFAKALSYFQRSLGIENDQGTDKEQLSIRLFNIGEAFEKLDSLEEAYAFYYNTLLIEEDLGNKEGIFYARLGIGKVDARTGNRAKASEELSKALAFAQELDNQMGICEVQIALGGLYTQEKLFLPAQSSFEVALEKSRSFQYPQLEVEALRGLYLLYREKGDYKTAMEKQEECFALQKALNSAEVNSKIGELQTRYEVKKKEQEIELLRREDKIQQQEREYDRKLRNYLIIIVIFVLVTFAYNLWRRK